MSLEDRVRWDAIFRQQARLSYPAPDPLLLQFTPMPKTEESRALDLCAGMGQNGLWLASQGYATDLIDISRVALQRARMEMSARNLRNVNLFQQDVDELLLEYSHYDVVCVFRYLKRDLFPLLKRSVNKGGRMVYETFNMGYLSVVPGFNPYFLLRENELASYFKDWHILMHDETTFTSRIVAVKP